MADRIIRRGALAPDCGMHEPIVLITRQKRPFGKEAECGRLSLAW